MIATSRDVGWLRSDLTTLMGFLNLSSSCSISDPWRDTLGAASDPRQMQLSYSSKGNIWAKHGAKLSCRCSGSRHCRASMRETKHLPWQVPSLVHACTHARSTPVCWHSNTLLITEVMASLTRSNEVWFFQDSNNLWTAKFAILCCTISPRWASKYVWYIVSSSASLQLSITTWKVIGDNQLLWTNDYILN